MPTSFVTELKKHLQEEDWAIIIRALRHDQIIWNQLQNEEFAYKALQIIDNNIEKWSPANLSLISLGYEKYLPALLSNSSDEVGENIRHEAAAAYEEFLSDSEIYLDEISLSNIGLLALALRERWRILGNWSKVISDLGHGAKKICYPVISCLYGILSQPEDLLKGLFSSETNLFHQELGIHAILSNPLYPEKQSQILTEFISILPSNRKLNLLRNINNNHPELGQLIAKNLIEFKSETIPKPKDKIQAITNLLEKSEILQISRQYSEAMPALEEAWQNTIKLHADLTAQLAQAAAKDNDKDTALQALEKVSQIDSQLSDLEPNITIAQIHTGQLATGYEEFNPKESNVEPISPTTLLATARLAIQNNDRQKAQLIAQQTLEISLHLNYSSKLSQDTHFNQVTTPPEFLQSLSETLLDLELPIEACRAAELALETNPNDSRILWILSRSYLKIGNQARALELAQITTALSPNNPIFQRNLIEILISCQEWHEAKNEIEALISKNPTPASEDFHILARCALKTNQSKQAAQACQRALHLNPQDGTAHSMLGEAYKTLGDISSAFGHFNQAIATSPHLPKPWLAIASHHKEKGAFDKAKERLLAANQAIPEHPEIHFELGQIYLKENNPTKALEEFKNAAKHNTQDYDPKLKQEIAIKLGKTLFNLSYFDDALIKLESAHKAFPSNPKIAHLYGKVLIVKEDLGSALSAFAIAMQSNEDDPEVLLDFGLAHLKLGNHPDVSIRAIKRSLEVDPDKPRGWALLAEATAQSGDQPEALGLFKKALESELVNDPQWHARLSLGFAETAFALNKPEIAIASIKDALQNSPEDFNLLKTLCQAYTQAQLHKDAHTILVEIFSRGEDNLEILLWVADQALTLNKSNIAVEALNQAAKLAPQRAEILVRLGYIQLENNQPEIARETFGQLFSSENVDTNDLRLAAQALIGLGDISSSIPYIERALELSNYQSTDLLGQLTILHMKTGDYKAALNTLEIHIELLPNNPGLWEKKSKIFAKLGRPKAAIQCILKALDLSPEDANLHKQAAILFRKESELKASLEHIEIALEINPADGQIYYLAIEINLACLKFKKARELLFSQEEPPAKNINWAFVKIEQSIELGNWEAAKPEIKKSTKLTNGHPRILALQARILHLEGHTHAANKTLEQALLNLDSFDTSELESHIATNIRLSIVEAAISLGNWDIAKIITQLAIEETPLEPRPHLTLAKLVTVKAEYQHNCQAVLAKYNTPGCSAFNQAAKEMFDESIQNALKTAPLEESKTEIRRWQTRGNYSIHNHAPEENKLQLKTPEDQAALIAARRRAGALSIMPEIEEVFSAHPSVLFQLSLSLAKDEPSKAIETITKAIELKPEETFFLALKAFLAKRTGEISLGLECINQALTIRSQEPRWHDLAAEFYMDLGRYSSAKIHLEQACQLESDHAPHFYNLGKAYALDLSPKTAIKAFEKAIQLNATHSDYWLALLDANKKINDLVQAAYCAEQLIKLNPSQVEPLLIRANIALAENEVGKASKFVTQAKKLKPEDPHGLRSLSQTLLGLGQTEEALSVLDNAISLSLEPLPLLLERAEIIQVINGREAKLETLKALARDYPNDPTILAAIVSVYVENNQVEKAILTAQHALKLNQEQLDLKQRAQLQYQLGALLRQSGQLDQAIHHLKMAIDIAPRFIESYFEIGQTHHQRREHQKALEYFNQAISIAPNTPIPYREAGIILKECKDYIGAETMLRRAATLAPKDLYIQRQLGAVIALTLVHQPQEV